jgi:hypothetical protein
MLALVSAASIAAMVAIVPAAPTFAVAAASGSVTSPNVSTTGVAKAAAKGAPKTHSAPDADPDVSRIVREHFRLQDSPLTSISPNADNYAARTSSRSPLLLFLAATGHHPSQYKDFLAAARQRGYHVLALDYWNDGMSVERTCGQVAACYTEVQRNRLDGSDPSQYSSVNPANSIVNRLRDSISHLRAVDEGGDWEQFLTGDEINWSDIVVAGHSQGGGEAAYISHLHSVHGVLMFSSPVDSDGGVDASWMSSRGATPASRMYGFDDSGDIFWPRIVASWNALGMGSFGPPTNVAKGMPADSHELLSSLDLGTPVQAHLRDVTDYVPLEDGKPVYSGVWKWMLEQAYGITPSLTRA